jgi:hypothetical protein
MRVWLISYVSTERLTVNDRAVVLSPTAGGAIRKLCKRIRIGPQRIVTVEEISCDVVVVKA